MTLTENASTSPDGTLSAERWVAAAGANAARAQTIVNAMPAGSLSAWFRLTNAASFNPANPLKTRAVLTDLVGGWYSEPVDWGLPIAWERRALATTPATQPTAVQLSHKGAWPGSAAQYPALAAADFAVWGWQLEEGTFPSSYIATSASAVTRRADQLIFDAKDVPSWVRTGTWQLDVLPLFASGEIATTDEFVLVAWEGGQISLAKDGTGGALKITSGTTSVRQTIEWARNTKLTVTVNTGAASISVRGASKGDGSFSYGTMAVGGTGRVAVGSLLDGTKAAFARLSEVRKVVSATVACVADPDCVRCGDGIVSPEGEESCDPALTAYCDSSCLPTDAPTKCQTDIDCPPAQRCGLGNGPLFGEASYTNFCWPVDRCPGECGDLHSPCGECACTSNCTTASCGHRASDGCGSVCEGSCGLGAEGCLDNRDCPSGTECAPVGTARKCIKTPGYSALMMGYFPPQTLSDGSACYDGPLCPKRACDSTCAGFCNTRGECLSSDTSPSCPSSCPHSCDNEGRCYEKGIPTAPQTPNVPAPATGVGELRGSLSVEEDGAARYLLPLQMPPGRAGLQPDLALAYSSRGGDGPLGLGWALTGISAIGLCESSASDDGIGAPVQSPALCLDGDPLRSLFDNAGNLLQSVQNEPFYYRPRYDSGYVIQGTVSTWEATDGTGGTRSGMVPGDTFVMYRDDGTMLTFGGQPDYLFRGGQDPLMGPSDVRKWLLAKVEDQYGNRIGFEYQKGYYHFTGSEAYVPATKSFLTDPSGSVTRQNLETEVVLRRISYNFDGSVANSEVTFHYNEDKLARVQGGNECDADGHCTFRPAVHIKYWHGGPLGSLLMLDRIEARTMGRLVRSYDLGQQTTEAGRITLLDWVQECDYDHRGATCLPHLDLSYGDPTEPDVSEMGHLLDVSTKTQFNKKPWQYLGEYTAVADVDGDGADDYLVFGDDGALWMATGENTEKFAKVASETVFPTFFVFRKTEGKNQTYDVPFGMQATDWNKDGLSDLLVWGLDQKQHNDGENIVSRCLDQTAKICGRNDGAGRLSATVPLGVWVYLAHLDGTKVSFTVDRILTEAGAAGEPGLAAAAKLTRPIGVHLSGSIGDPGPTRHARIALLDYNQDGLTDILYCTNARTDQGNQLGAIAITTGSHLGSRWVGSFDASMQAEVSKTTPFHFNALTGASYNFCAHALPIQTRPGRVEVWDPDSRTVLTQQSSGPAIVPEKTFGNLKLSAFDIQLADLNGDALSDIVLHARDDKAGKIEWWFNTGTGFFAGQGVGFVPGQKMAATHCEFRHLASAVIADFNSDGLDDFILPSCAFSRSDRVDGLAVLYARRSTIGVVDFEAESLVGITPSCENASDWAPDVSPFRAFTGDFDGDGDTDLRVLGQEWNNGAGSHNVCSRFAPETMCCLKNHDQDGNVASYKCYINAQGWTPSNSTGACTPETAERYDPAQWQYFIEDITNSTLGGPNGSWYLLSRATSSPVAGKVGTEVEVTYSTGAGNEVWNAADPAAPCAGALSRTPRSNAKGVSAAPAAAAINGRRVYQRTTAGSGCNVPGAAWCGGRVPSAMVSAVSVRTSDNAGGWASCADQRLFYENARVDAWNGHSGFERITRLNRAGGVLRSTEVADYDLQPVPLRYGRLAGELMLAGMRPTSIPTPVLLYPFASEPVKTTVTDAPGSGHERVSIRRTLAALIDYGVEVTYVPSSWPGRRYTRIAPVVTYSASELPIVRALDGTPTDRRFEAQYWQNWQRGDEDSPPVEPLRVVHVIDEEQTLEGNRAVTTSGTWTTVSPVGFASESFSWSAGASRLADLQQSVAALKAATDPASGQRLALGTLAGWFASSHDAVELSATIALPHVLGGPAPDWPTRQAFTTLPSQIATVSYGRPDQTGHQDARAQTVAYTYDARAGLSTRVTDHPGEDPLREVFTPTRTGFVTMIERLSSGACAPACREQVVVTPDSLELFPSAITNGKEQTTRLVFNSAHGRPTRVTAPDGVVESRTYDPFGRLESSSTEGTTRSVSYQYSPVNAYSVSTTDAGGALAVPAMYRQVTAEFDLRRGKMPQRSVDRWFDAAGTEVRSGETGLDGLVVWSEAQFDLRGRAVRSTRPHVEPAQASQGTVRMEYDVLDRVAKIVSPSPTESGDRWVRYDYGSVGDAAGEASRWLGSAFPRHRRVVVETNSEASDAKLVKAVDAAGGLVTSAQASVSGGDAITTYELGADGKPTRITSPDKGVLLIKYDAVGRRANLADPESGKHTWAYDGFGRVSSSNDNGTHRSFAYDRLHRLVTEQVTDTDLANAFTTRWDWDRTEQDRLGNLAEQPHNAGKLMGVRRSDGYEERYTYLGRLNQVDSSYVAIPRPDATKVELLAGFQYDEQARPTTTYYPGGALRTQTLHYNEFGAVHRVTSTGSGRPERTIWSLTNVFQGRRYQDVAIADGRLREHHDYHPGTDSLRGVRSVLDAVTVQDDSLGRDGLGRIVKRAASGAAPSTFSYDAFGRVEHRWEGEGAERVESESYAYSKGGRMATKHGATLGYVATGEQRFPNAVKSIVTDGETLTYQYKSDYGLVTSITGSRDGSPVDVQLSYDVARRVHRMSESAGGSSTFSYSPAGRRVGKYTADATGSTFTTYLGKYYERVELPSGVVRHVFRMTDPTGQPVVEESIDELAQGAGGARAGAFGAATERALVRDYQGSVLAASVQGAPAALRRYSTFGEPLGASTTELGYTGHRDLVSASDDFGAGLVDMGGRVYDPTSGQFIQPDPYFPAMDHPQGFNRRSYVANDPVNFVDPTGYCGVGEQQGGSPCPGDGVVSIGGGEGYRWARGKHVRGKMRREKRNFKDSDKERRKAEKKRFNVIYQPPDPSGSTLGDARTEVTGSGPSTTSRPPGSRVEGGSGGRRSQDPGALKRITEDGKPSAKPWKDALSMFWNFVTGTGPELRVFGPGSTQVSQMQDAPGVRRARDFFYSKNKSESEVVPQALDRVTDFIGAFGGRELYGAGGNATQQFVGSYTVDIYPSNDGKSMRFFLWNSTSMTSFAYHALPSWTRGDMSYFGNMYQGYTWTEFIDQSRL